MQGEGTAAGPVSSADDLEESWRGQKKRRATRMRSQMARRMDGTERQLLERGQGLFRLFYGVCVIAGLVQLIGLVN